MIRRIQKFCRLVVAGAFALSFVAIPEAVLAATFNHQQIAYFVPEKRIRIDSGISDPKGVQVARVYFKAGAQADYIFVPMAQSGGRYVATLPAPSANAGSMEYLLLALNNDGQVSRTEAYKVAARRSNETPSWQSAGGQGDVKVFTEIPNAPKPVAMYSDSIAMDVVESGARLGAAAGLYAGTGGGGAGAGAATAKSAAGTSTTSSTTAASASAGGLSTAAIVGGVVLAGAAVAAASGGGGGGGGSPSPPAPSPGDFAGSWSGTSTIVETANPPSCSSTAVTCNGTWSGTVSSSGFFSGTETQTCSAPLIPTQSFTSPISGQLTSNGSIANFFATPGVAPSGVTCTSGVLQFTLSPRRVTGTASCTSSAGSCSFTATVNFTGS